MIKVFIVDDHKIIRDGLELVFNTTPNIRAVEEASSGEEAIKKARLCAPDVILMDLIMPGMDGLESVEEILKRNPEQKILAYSSIYDKRIAKALRDRGVFGYISKEAELSELLAAINTIHAGNNMLKKGGFNLGLLVMLIWPGYLRWLFKFCSNGHNVL